MVYAFSRLAARASGLDISQGGIACARNHFKDCEFFADFRRKRGLEFGFRILE